MGRLNERDSYRPELSRIYSEVDRRVAEAGPACEASGRCCRFKEYGHTLFLSHVEAEFLLADAPPYDKPVSADGCPFQVGNLCTARESRPLGCRIYFCDPDYQETSHRITEDALRELKALADAQGLGWRYAPLHVFLNEMARPAAADARSPDNSRIPLPLTPDRTEEASS